MAGREELVDAIAGFALFADLTAPQLEGIVHTFEEAVFGDGRAGPPPGHQRLRLLRDPRWRGGRRGRRHGAGPPRPRRLLRGGVDPARRDADRRRRRACARCAAWSSPGRPSRRSWSPTRGSCTGCSRPRHAGSEPRTDGGADPPVPARDYPVVVIGSGPGGLQVSYSLRRLGVPHAVISADPSPGGMFRRWPFFQRLLSWTKPHAPAARGSRAYERYDWNSLLGDEPETTGDPAGPDGRQLLLPVAPRDGGEPRGVRRAGRARGPLRLRMDGRRTCSSPGRRRRAVRARDDRRPVSLPRAGPRGRGRRAVHAARAGHGARVPLRRRPPGRDVRRPAGLHHRQAELRVRARERAAAVGPPARPGLAVADASCRSTRARSSASGPATSSRTRTTSWAAAWRSSMPRSTELDRDAGGALTIHLRRTDGGGDLALAVDDVISATGFVAPLRDLPVLGVATFGASELPAARRPGGRAPRCPACSSPARIGQGAKGLRGTASRPTRGPSTAPATTRGSSPAHIARTRVRRGAGSTGDRARTPSIGFVAARAGRGARAVPPARLPRPRPDRRSGRRLARRRRPAARPRARLRAGRTRRGDPRGRRQRGDLPGPLHAASAGRRREHGDRPGPARCGTTRRRDASGDRRARSGRSTGRVPAG